MIKNAYISWNKYVPLLLLVLLVLYAGKVYTQSSTNYTIKKSVVCQGGTSSESSNYRVFDAVGQPSPAGEAASTGYGISSGFLGNGGISTDILEKEEPFVPVVFKLCQNYPNPFNPETKIEYHLPQPSEVNLIIYDVRGRVVRELIREIKPVGYHEVIWDSWNSSGQKVAAGIYIYRIEIQSRGAGDHGFVDVKKMVLMK
jgi:hypothetical protein